MLVRLAGCNLSCSWCDSKYTWDWNQHDRAAETISVATSEIIRRVKDTGVRNIVITGGEPMLQQSGLLDVITPLSAEGFTFEVETNGTISPVDAMCRLVNQWNVSPKLSNSGIDVQRRLVPTSLRAFSRVPNTFLKFVIENPEDFDEVEALTRDLGVAAERVVIMPEGRDADAVLARSQWLSPECIRRNYRLSMRLHILLWGDIRGT